MRHSLVQAVGPHHPATGMRQLVTYIRLETSLYGLSQTSQDVCLPLDLPHALYVNRWLRRWAWVSPSRTYNSYVCLPLELRQALCVNLSLELKYTSFIGWGSALGASSVLRGAGRPSLRYHTSP
jgi:hypothetical protein